MQSVAIALLSIVLLAPVGRTQEGPLVGEPAPPFVATTCVNRPEVVSSDALLGEVILLEFWGIT